MIFNIDKLSEYPYKIFTTSRFVFKSVQKWFYTRHHCRHEWSATRMPFMKVWRVSISIFNWIYFTYHICLEPQKKPEKTVENVPTINRSIPDFISDQTKFTQALQKAKQNKATTVWVSTVVGFGMTLQSAAFQFWESPSSHSQNQTANSASCFYSSISTVSVSKLNGFGRQKIHLVNFFLTSQQFYSKETKSSILLKKKLETDRNMKKVGFIFCFQLISSDPGGEIQKRPWDERKEA